MSQIEQFFFKKRITDDSNKVQPDIIIIRKEFLNLPCYEACESKFLVSKIDRKYIELFIRDKACDKGNNDSAVSNSKLSLYLRLGEKTCQLDSSCKLVLKSQSSIWKLTFLLPIQPVISSGLFFRSDRKALVF